MKHYLRTIELVILFLIRIIAGGYILAQGWETVSYTHLTLPTNREV